MCSMHVNLYVRNQVAGGDAGYYDQQFFGLAVNQALFEVVGFRIVVVALEGFRASECADSLLISLSFSAYLARSTLPARRSWNSCFLFSPAAGFAASRTLDP